MLHLFGELLGAARLGHFTSGSEAIDQNRIVSIACFLGSLCDCCECVSLLKEYEQKFAGRLLIEKTDAFTAVTQRAQKAGDAYDAVLVDCFAPGGEVPESCRSQEFAEKVKHILKPGGMMLQNIWNYSPMRKQVRQQFEQTKTTYGKVYDGAFEDVHVPMPPDLQWVEVLKSTKKQ
jgi:spermidine synthase